MIALLIIAGAYLLIGFLWTVGICLDLGNRLETTNYPESRIQDARESLRMAWSWPWSVIKFIFVFCFGTFCRGLAAAIRGKP